MLQCHRDTPGQCPQALALEGVDTVIAMITVKSSASQTLQSPGDPPDRSPRMPDRCARCFADERRAPVPQLPEVGDSGQFASNEHAGAGRRALICDRLGSALGKTAWTDQPSLKPK